VSFQKIITGSLQADNVLSSSNYVPGVSGWMIDGDGNAEFNDVEVRGDIISGNWDGAEPIDLSTVDMGATTGFALDSSAGSAQFMGDLFLGGNLTLFGNGLIRTESGGAATQMSKGSIIFESGDANEEAPAQIQGDVTDPLGTGAQGAMTLTSPLDVALNYSQLNLTWDGAWLAGVVGNSTAWMLIESDQSINFGFGSSTLMSMKDEAGHNLQGLAYDNYTPTLTNLNVGSTGAVNTARYVRIGDVVHVEIFITLGGTGISVGDVRIQLPFNPAFGTNSPAAGECLFVESGVGIYKGALNFAGNVLHVRRLNVSGSNVTIANLSSTTPFTWGAGDSIRISAVYKAA